MRAIRALVPGIEPETSFSTFDVDSRRIEPGSLFVALIGGRTDGHLFVLDACRQGASGAVVEESFEPPTDLPDDFALFYVADTQAALEALGGLWRSGTSAKVIGITGSLGKTSAKETLAYVLGERFQVEKSPKNWNTEIGVPLTLARIAVDTEVLIVEMAMRGRGQIKLLSEIARPSLAVITNTRSIHQETLASRAQIVAAKLEITAGLDPAGSLWLNRDEAAFVWLGDEEPSQVRFQDELGFSGEVRTFSVEGRADASASDYTPAGLMGSTFGLVLPDSRAPVDFPLLGKGAVASAVAVAGAAWKFGMGAEEISERLSSLRPLEGRLFPIELPSGNLILDDTYNAGPDSVLNALGVLRSVELLDKRPVVVVLGDMLELGDITEKEHVRVGRALSALLPERAVIAGDYTNFVAQGAGGDAPWLVQVEDGENGKYGDDFVARIIDALGSDLPGDAVILVKGSRAAGLERVVEALASAEGIGRGGDEGV